MKKIKKIKKGKRYLVAHRYHEEIRYSVIHIGERGLVNPASWWFDDGSGCDSWGNASSLLGVDDRVIRELTKNQYEMLVNIWKK